MGWWNNLRASFAKGRGPGYLQESDGSKSSSRLLMVGGGTLVTLSWLGGLITAGMGFIHYDQVGRFLEGITELFKWLVVPYLGNQAKAAVRSMKAPPPANAPLVGHADSVEMEARPAPKAPE